MLTDKRKVDNPDDPETKITETVVPNSLSVKYQNIERHLTKAHKNNGPQIAKAKVGFQRDAHFQ